MKLLIFILMLFFSILSWGNCKPLPPSILKNTTLFFYLFKKEHTTYYVPIAQLVNGNLTTAKIQPPATMKLYDLRNNKPILIHFKNEWNTVTDSCIVWGKSKSQFASNTILYATQPFTKIFNFNPSKTEREIFRASVKNACRPGQKKYNMDGIALCNADNLVATSHLLGQTYFWQTKQYRYDIGFAVNLFDKKNKKLNPIADDCSMCAD